MQCENCGDPVCIRDAREGVIHKNGRYGCRTRHNGQLACAEVTGDAEQRLLLAASVKVPVEEPKNDRRRKPNE